MIEILEKREVSHGDFTRTLPCAERLFEVYSTFAKGKNAPAGHDEAIHQICVKLARIACGAAHQDHYDDIIGYAEIAKALAVPVQAQSILPKWSCSLCGHSWYEEKGVISTHCPKCNGNAPK